MPTAMPERAVDEQVREARRQHERLLRSRRRRSGMKSTVSCVDVAQHLARRGARGAPPCSASPRPGRRRWSRSCPGRRQAGSASRSPARAARACRRSRESPCGWYLPITSPTICAHLTCLRSGAAPSRSSRYRTRRWTGFSPSRTSGQRAPDDDRHGVVEIRGAHLLLEPARLDVAAAEGVDRRHRTQTSRFAHEAGVLLDELRGAARPDRPSASRRPGRRRPRPPSVTWTSVRRRGIHRRVAQLIGVHLAQALEAVDVDAAAGEVEHRLAQVGEGRAPPSGRSPSVTVNAGVPASSTSCSWTRGELRGTRWRRTASRDRWCVRARPLLPSTARTTTSDSSSDRIVVSKRVTVGLCRRVGETAQARRPRETRSSRIPACSTNTTVSCP